MGCLGEERGWGECKQRVRPCWFCVDPPDRVDSYYLEKVHGGLITKSVLSELELAATMGGRLHGDGRRLDQYAPRDGLRLSTDGEVIEDG